MNLLEKFVTERRKNYRLTQNELAKALGYDTSQFVSNWERGLCTVPTEKFLTIAKVLNVPIKKLVDLRVRDFKNELYSNVVSHDSVLTIANHKKAKRP